MATSVASRRPTRALLPFVLRPGAVWRFFTDRKAPLLPKLALGAAVLYILSPVDLVPDLVPIFGWLDDIGAFTMAIAWLGREVHRAEVARDAQIIDVEQP